VPDFVASPTAPDLSVVLPVYDEVEALPALVAELEAALRATGRTWEIILVDDGSRDGTAAWIADAARTRAGYAAVLFESNAGQSAALAAGIARARGAIVITLDADGQNDPADIPRLLEALRDADVVSGIRRDRADSFVRLASSRIANATRRMVLGDPVTDIGCSLKAYRRETLDALPFFVGAHRFLPALCYFRGARLVEIPVAHRPRQLGRSKYGVGNRLFRGLRDLMGVAWLRSRLLRHRVREVIRHAE
jgi:glycosyltransferase involved in cell wall biosynthesis